MNSFLELRVRILLSNLEAERTGWRRVIFGRFRVPSEPLRADAKAILRDLRRGDPAWEASP